MYGSQLTSSSSIFWWTSSFIFLSSRSTSNARRRLSISSCFSASINAATAASSRLYNRQEHKSISNKHHSHSRLLMQYILKHTSFKMNSKSSYTLDKLKTSLLQMSCTIQSNLCVHQCIGLVTPLLPLLWIQTKVMLQCGKPIPSSTPTCQPQPSLCYNVI